MGPTCTVGLAPPGAWRFARQRRLGEVIPAAREAIPAPPAARDAVATRDTLAARTGQREAGYAPRRRGPGP